MIREHVLRTLRSLGVMARLPALAQSRWGRAVTRPRSEDPEHVGEIPAEVSRARGRRWLSPLRLLSSRLLVTRASPQPAWLGHPVSWSRDELGWIGRSPSGARAGRAPVTSPPVGPLALSSTRPWTTARAGAFRLVRAACAARQPRRTPACARMLQGRGPPPERLREEELVPLHPRCLRSSSHPVRGVEVIHRLLPTCGLLPAPLQSTPEPPPLTG